MTDQSEDNRMDSLMSGLATAAKSRKGRTALAAALPWLGMALTGALGVVGGKMDSKAELAAALELRNDFKLGEKAAALRHAEVLHELAALEERLLSDSIIPKDQGRVVRLEKGQYFAWRAMAELRAAAYTDQPERRRRHMDELGAKFAVMFDKRAQNQPPAVAYDEVFAQAHVE